MSNKEEKVSPAEGNTQQGQFDISSLSDEQKEALRQQLNAEAKNERIDRRDGLREKWRHSRPS